MSDFINHYEIPLVKTVDDLVENYTDFYISKKKDEDGQNIDIYFKFFAILKKKKKEKRAKTTSIYYFGKKKEAELSREYSKIELDNYERRFNLFCIHFQNLKRFYEIAKFELELKEY